MKTFDFKKTIKKDKSQYKSILELLKNSKECNVENFQGFEITGTKPFIDLFIQALLLLEKNDRINYNRVSKYIKKITMYTLINSGFAFPSIFVYVQHLDDALSESLEWMTSCLVHEMVHCVIFHKLVSKGHHIEKFREEQACVRVQVRSLQRLGRDIPDRAAYVDEIMKMRWYTFWGKLKRLLGI